MKQKINRSNLANVVTASRIVLSVRLLFVPAFSVPFYVYYILGAVTDMADGAIARVLHQESAFGAKLDTIADWLFVSVVLIKIIPNVSIPLWLWIWIALIASLKLFNLLYGFVVYRCLVADHSVMNKITGLMLFILPLTIVFPRNVFAVECILTCAVATFAAVQEGYYIRTGKVTVL